MQVYMPVASYQVNDESNAPGFFLRTKIDQIILLIPHPPPYISYLKEMPIGFLRSFFKIQAYEGFNNKPDKDVERNT